jgi:chloramphenicol 3-O-phosphotransferase
MECALHPEGVDGITQVKVPVAGQDRRRARRPGRRDGVNLGTADLLAMNDEA